LHTLPGIFMWGTYLTSNLMLFNLLPWPPLDGYRFVEATYERTRKKKIKPNVEQIMKQIGTGLTFLFIFILII
jgi:regulator of sigma E protease